MEGKILEVPQFIPFVHKLTKHFVLTVAYDVPKIWQGLSVA